MGVLGEFNKNLKELEKLTATNLYFRGNSIIIKSLPKKVEQAVKSLSKKISALYPDIPNSRWLAMRLLDGDQQILNALKNGELINQSNEQ